MIALGETDPTSAEVPFFLPLATNPTTGVTGHNFASGEVLLKLPGQSWFNVAVGQIVEKGFGRYCVQLTTAQTQVAGNVYVRSVVAGAQPGVFDEEIGTEGGDLQVAVGGGIPFFLPNSVDPVNGAPIIGHNFVLGEVQIRLPRASYVNVPIAQISEVGYGAYEVAVLPSQAVKGKAFIFASVTGAQPFEAFATILSPGVGVAASSPTTATGATTPASRTKQGLSGALVFPLGGYGSVPVVATNHPAAALNRLCEQFRSTTPG